MLPLENNLPKSFNKLKESVGMDKMILKEKRFCQNCSAEIFETSSVEMSIKSVWKCINKSCFGQDITNYDSFFFTDIKPQLYDLINSNLEIINNFTNQSREHLDLIDGTHYKKIQKANTLHLMVFSDGTPIKKSSYKQFWPVFVGLCQLPRTLRESIRNKIISGIWFGKKKPTLIFYLNP